jgi:hypothetical protein
MIALVQAFLDISFPIHKLQSVITKRHTTGAIIMEMKDSPIFGIYRHLGLIVMAGALFTSDVRADITTGLVMKFSFDETSGVTAADSSGNGNNASLINFPTDGTPYWVKGRIGGALEFCADGGDDDQVVTDNPISLANQDIFSFAFWAKRKSDNNPFNPRLVGPVRDTDGQYWVLWAPGTGVGFYPPAKSPEPIRDVWQHFVVTYNRTNGSYVLFVDGVKKTQATATGYVKNEAGDSQWVIGHKELLNDNRDPWRGYLDDVRVYNRVLTDADIQELYSQAPPLPPTIVKQPRGGAFYAGETIQFSTVVDGTPPISYQWRKDGNNIGSETNDTFVILSAKPVDAGAYTVVVGNVGGNTTSSVVNITVQAVTSVTNGLAGYWKLDETTGSVAADSSGSGNNGTVYPGDAQWTNGVAAGALYFRGPGNGDDYVVAPTFPPAKATMTLSAWAFAEARPNRARVACGGSGGNGIGQFMLNLDGDTGDLHGYILNSAGQQSDFREGAATPIPTNQWQHVALVADGAKLRVFRNGTEVGVANYDGTLFQSTNAFSIGARLTADDTAAESGWWQGKLDDIGYWTRGLTTSEIVAIYSAGAANKNLTQADRYPAVAPVVTQLPQGASVVAGNAFLLKVMATGTPPLSYQWKLNGQDIIGATNMTYQVSASSTNDAGSYTFTVTNSVGSKTTDLVTVAVSDPPVDLTTALVLHLKFDEAAGTTAHDASPKAITASLINFPTDQPYWVPGVISGALLYNQPNSGDDDAVVTDAAVELANQDQFTFSFWAKARKPYGDIFNPRFISPLSGEHWILWKPGFGVGIWDQVPVTVEPSGDSWHHFGVIFDRAAKSYSVYVDGTRRADAVSATKVEPGNVQWIIGHQENPDQINADNWRGSMDDVRIYNRLLTPKDVNALFNLGQPPALTVSLSGSTIQISWPADATGYTLQTSDTLPATAWTPVPGVVNNSVTITPSAARAFYRLLK